MNCSKNVLSFRRHLLPYCPGRLPSTWVNHFHQRSMLNTAHIKPTIERYITCAVNKSRGKVHPRAVQEGPEGEQRYSYTLSPTSALDGVRVNAKPRPVYPRERPGTHCIGGCVNLRAGLDWYGKSHPHRDSIPGPSSPYRVAIPTELSLLRAIDTLSLKELKTQILLTAPTSKETGL